MALPLIFLDTETTGLQPSCHTPWEAAWATAIHDPATRSLRIVDEFCAFVLLTMLEEGNADPVALDIGGFNTRYRHHNAQSKRQVIHALRDHCREIAALTTHKVPWLVGAVPSFDHAMISQNWTGWPGFGQGLWHYQLIDVETLAMGHMTGLHVDSDGVQHDEPMGMAPIDTTELFSAFGVHQDQATKHTAAGDVLGVIDLYAAVYGLTIFREKNRTATH